MGGTTGTGLNHHRGPFNHDGPIYNEMRPRGIEPDGEQAVKDAETVRQAGLNAITPSFFELFEDYIAEEDSQLAADGVELEARTAWMHEMYRAMLNTLKE